MQKIKVSEIFFSIQGEGRFVGVPSIFLRTFGCNFTCDGFGMPAGQRSQERHAIDPTQFRVIDDLPLVSTGCDSYLSWDPRFKHLSPVYTTAELGHKFRALLPGRQWTPSTGNDVHLVITGGEPLLGWQRAYPELLAAQLDLGLQNVTFETNGTQPVQDELRKFINDPFGGDRIEFTFSISPKLSASGEKWSDAVKRAGTQMKKGNTEIVKLLLLKKVPDTHVLNKALVSATRGCHAQTVKLLLQSGADADSALLWAGTEILNILLQEGANIYANNDSALRWASDFHCHDIVNILVMHYIELKRRLDKSIDDAFDILASHNDSYVGMIALLVVEDPRLIDRIKSKKTKDAVCIELLRMENVAVTFVAEQIQSRKTPLVRYLLHVMATMVYIPINV